MTQYHPCTPESADTERSVLASDPAARSARPKRPRRMARPVDQTIGSQGPSLPKPTKLDQIAAMISRPEGATITELMEETGWQAHSVRGAIAGALKKRDLVITSQIEEQVRRYRSQPAG